MVDDLTERLVCPSCRHPLIWRDDGSDCSECLQAYPVVDGIPLLVADLDQAKLMQAHYFDAEADADYETTRPHGTPALYSALLTDKFRRATRTLAAGLDGATVVVACGGSAMDAEYLARAGARVISTDISPGAAERLVSGRGASANRFSPWSPMPSHCRSPMEG